MSGHTSIAVVDDDPSVCTSLCRLLRLARFEAVCYPSAQAFFADSARHRYDCLVLDVRMPGMSGIELFARIVREGAHPPVIFISALDDPAARAQAQALGCAGFFSKSTPGAEIIAAIRHATTGAH